MPMNREELTKMVKAAIADAVVELVDTAGDNDHWHITVTSVEFEGKSRVQQHQMVMGAIDGMGTKLHALAVTTKLPA